MAQHNTITMILITLNPKGRLAFLDFLIVTIATMGKMNENALHANEGYAAILIAGVIKIFWEAAKYCYWPQ